MTKKSETTRWLASFAVFAVFLIVAIIAIWALKLVGGERTTLLLGLVVLGTVGACLTWYLLRPTAAARILDRRPPCSTCNWRRNP